MLERVAAASWVEASELPERNDVVLRERRVIGSTERCFWRFD
jgi:G:T-mismatch repair DNA endonuclease (very short patch repair protein)